jgi:hypothetical protein
VIGFPGKNGRMKKYRMDGIVEVVTRRSGKRATVWRFAPWVGRALGPNPGENSTEGNV